MSFSLVHFPSKIGEISFCFYFFFLERKRKKENLQEDGFSGKLYYYESFQNFVDLV